MGKYVCNIHSCSGKSPDGKCQLCVYDDMNQDS